MTCIGEEGEGINTPAIKGLDRYKKQVKTNAYRERTIEVRGCVGVSVSSAHVRYPNFLRYLTLKKNANLEGLVLDDSECFQCTAQFGLKMSIQRRLQTERRKVLTANPTSI